MNRLWRFGNRLSRRNGILRKVARVVELVNHVICSCSVSIDAEIGERTVFFHRGIGCVVHPIAKIGSDCKIFQGVTLGSKWSNATCTGDAPHIGNNVMIGAGAVILGDIYVGDNTIIGANAVVTCDIPDNSIAVGIPVRVKKINSGELK